MQIHNDVFWMRRSITASLSLYINHKECEITLLSVCINNPLLTERWNAATVCRSGLSSSWRARREKSRLVLRYPQQHLSNQTSHIIKSLYDRHNKWILKSVLNRDLQRLVTEPIRFVSVISSSDNRWGILRCRHFNMQLSRSVSCSN